MRKITGQVLSTKPVSLSRAAKLITRFAAVDNGSSPAIALYLESAAEAFNHLVQSHKKPLQNGGDQSDRKRVQKLQSEWLGENTEGELGRDSGNRAEYGDDFIGAAEANPRVDEYIDLNNEGEENSEQKKKTNKNKKRKGDLVDKEDKSSKKRKMEHPDL